VGYRPIKATGLNPGKPGAFLVTGSDTGSIASIYHRKLQAGHRGAGQEGPFNSNTVCMSQRPILIHARIAQKKLTHISV
jgi:hypothetical protein